MHGRTLGMDNERRHLKRIVDTRDTFSNATLRHPTAVAEGERRRLLELFILREQNALGAEDDFQVG